MQTDLIGLVVQRERSGLRPMTACARQELEKESTHSKRTPIQIVAAQGVHFIATKL
jgi:hypothetical protein